uniref:Transmembrane protein n=1 Tax=Glossina austeni TaxID=7395 RepID=A0A1A9UJ93_GLOAU
MDKVMTKYEEVPYKPNLLLQVLMFCNVYLSAAWAGVYGFYILYNLFNFNDLHGNFIIIAYLFSAIIEYYRLYMGYKGNLKCRPGDLSTFLILSLLIQIPVLVFLLLSIKCFITLISVIIIGALSLMIMEFVVGIWVIWPNKKK